MLKTLQTIIVIYLKMSNFPLQLETLWLNWLCFKYFFLILNNHQIFIFSTSFYPHLIQQNNRISKLSKYDWMMPANGNFQNSYSKYISSCVMSCVCVIVYIDLTQPIWEATSTNVTIIPSINAVINVLLALSIDCHLPHRSVGWPRGSTPSHTFLPLVWRLVCHPRINYLPFLSLNCKWQFVKV